MTMKINIAGIVPFSTIDLRDKTAIVFFLAGCPFRCIYCQNYEYLNYKNLVDIDEIKSMIDRAEKFVDGVVFSGGEPTFQPRQLFILLKYCKSKTLNHQTFNFGYSNRNELYTGIQTNGFRYDVMKKCLPYLDMISLDVKAPLKKEIYGRICGIDEKVAELAIENIKKILTDEELIPRLEVKTTVYKEFVDLLPDIKKDIPENIDWIIQKGYIERIPPETTLTELRTEELEKITENLAKNRKNIWIRAESGDLKIS